MENNIYPVPILLEPQVQLEGGVFANKIFGGEKNFSRSTDATERFIMEDDQFTSNKFIPETIAFYSSKIDLHQSGRYQTTCLPL